MNLIATAQEHKCARVICGDRRRFKRNNCNSFLPCIRAPMHYVPDSPKSQQTINTSSFKPNKVQCHLSKNKENINIDYNMYNFQKNKSYLLRNVKNKTKNHQKRRIKANILSKNNIITNSTHNQVTSRTAQHKQQQQQQPQPQPINSRVNSHSNNVDTTADSIDEPENDMYGKNQTVPPLSKSMLLKAQNIQINESSCISEPVSTRSSVEHVRALPKLKILHKNQKRNYSFSLNHPALLTPKQHGHGNNSILKKQASIKKSTKGFMKTETNANLNHSELSASVIVSPQNININNGNHTSSKHYTSQQNEIILKQKNEIQQKKQFHLLCQRWFELSFLLRSPMRSIESFYEIKHQTFKSLQFLAKLETLSNELGVLRGTLSRTLLPFNSNTSVSDQAAIAIASGNNTRMNMNTSMNINSNIQSSIIASIDIETRNMLVKQAICLRKLVRVKIADDADLDQAKEALQTIQRFCSLMLRYANQASKSLDQVLASLIKCA